MFAYIDDFISVVASFIDLHLCRMLCRQGRMFRAVCGRSLSSKYEPIRPLKMIPYLYCLLENYKS